VQDGWAAERSRQSQERAIMIDRICSGFLGMKHTKLTAVISIFALILFNTAYGAGTSSTNRPAHWAKPIQEGGVPNLHKVSETLYRGAQPSAEGMKTLKAVGIETVINLRSFHSDRDDIRGTGLTYEHISMKAWHPEEEDAVRFLQIITNPKCSPVLVHCQHGADRTGTMCAVYRIAMQGWSKEEALKEMVQGGFGFHRISENLIQ
jgi:protein tyrosine/serine phosphatase